MTYFLSTSLRNLNISSNPLSTINVASSPQSKLPALNTIVMNDTRAQDWQSIDNLQISFGSSLRTFKYSLASQLLTPIQETNPASDAGKFKGTLEDRVYLIPKLPALEALNGTKVSIIEKMISAGHYS